MNKKIIQTILDNINIVEEVNKVVPLTKKGNNYVGLCPFHDDNNPSFTVNDQKKIAHCFVCGEGGNVINFYAKYHKCSYGDALNYYAKQLGIKQQTTQKKQEPMHILYNDVMNFCQTYLLTSEKGKNAYNYLLKRNITEQMMKKHYLGFLDKNTNLYQYLIKQSETFKKYSLFEIDNSNLFKEEYCFFANRIIIPIIDENNNCVGFSGRILDKENQVKYLNSKESKFFHKQKILYNFDQAKNNFQQNEIYIVEGFFDVYGFERLNIHNVVATMGVNFSQAHVKLLKKYGIKKIKLCFDQDNAGQIATLKIIDVLLKENFKNIEIITFNQGKDIDEFVNQGYSVNDFIKSDAISYKLNKIIKNYNLNNILEVNKFINEAIIGINNFSDNEQKIYIKKIADLLNFDESQIRSYIKKPQIEIKKRKFSKFSNNLNDDDIIIHTSFDRDGFEKIEYLIKQNGYIFNEKEKEVIYNAIKETYQKNENMKEILIPDLCDLLQQNNYNILLEIKNINVNKKDIEKIFLKKNKIKLFNKER